MDRYDWGGMKKKALRHVYCGPGLTVLRIFNASTLALTFLLSFHVYPLTRPGEVQSDHDWHNKTKTLSYLQDSDNVSLLKHPSRFIMNQNKQEVENENIVQNK